MLDFLIIGKNGQLASELIKLLRAEKVSFMSYSRNELDITDCDSVSSEVRKLKPRAIINTSAYHVLSECEKYPLKAFEVNSIAVGNLAKASQETGAKLLTLSTNYVFDGSKKTGYVEGDKVNPLQIYGLSKLAGEFDAINKYPDGTYVVRTCGLYGNGKIGSKDKKGNFVLKVIDEAKKTGMIEASSLEIVSPTYTNDLSLAILKLISLNAKPGIYHLVNEGETSWFDFAKTIVEYKKIRAKVVAKKDGASPYKRPIYSAMGSKKAKKLGIVLPRINESLLRYLDEL